MDIQQLRYFVAAAETGSITRAAARCRVAQPSVSQQIARLEAILQRPLLDRLPRGIALTEAGKALLPRAKRILSEYDDAIEHFADDIDEGAGRFTLGAIPTMAPYLFPDLLPQLARDFPRAHIHALEATTDILLAHLADHTIDAAILSPPIDHPSVTLSVVATEPLVLSVPTRHPLAQRDRAAIPDLRAEPAITLTEAHCLANQVAGFCASRRIAPNIVCRTDHLATTLALVEQGLGVALIPLMASRATPSKRRADLPFTRNAPTRDIAIATRRDTSPARITTHLTELTRQLCERHDQN